MPTPRMFNVFAGTSGNNDGIDAAAAHAAATDYYIQPPADERWEVARLIWSVVDAKGMETDTYGSQTALGTGLIFIVERDGVEYPLNASHPIQDNADMAHLCYDLQKISFTNTAEEIANARWTFSKSGQPIILKGRTSDKIICRFGAGDDLSGATEHHLCFQGVSLGILD
jgi:hypothetical protein